LAIGFVLMSFDEAAMIHEGLVGAAVVSRIISPQMCRIIL
jgi:hypothetical protein